MKKPENIFFPPYPPAPRQLVCSGGLGFDCLINHMVWTAGIKSKLDIFTDQELFCGQVSKVKGSATTKHPPHTEILLLGHKIHERHFSSSHMHRLYSQPQERPQRMSSRSVHGQPLQTAELSLLWSDVTGNVRHQGSCSCSFSHLINTLGALVCSTPCATHLCHT